MGSLAVIAEKVSASVSITRDEALYLYQNADNELLKHLSTLVKKRFHDPSTPTYLIMAIVNYTNICVAKCDYCSFYRLPHQPGGYLLSFEQLSAKIDQLVALGGTLVGFNGGFHPDLRINDYAILFQQLRNKYQKSLEFYEMTVAEFMFACKRSKMPYREGVAHLKAHGTRWITGGGAEILDDGFRRRHSPGKFSVTDYYAAQKEVLEGGVGSTATMVIGFDETLEERMNHLDSLRQFQAHTSPGLTSFLCWTYKPEGNALGGEEISTSEYLRWLAICRIFLDNFVNIRTSVLTKNEDALLGLLYGANDFDLPTADEVTEKAGATIDLDFERILNSVRRLGLSPQHRTPYARGEH